MNKKVFISYCWGDKYHQDWVVNLGQRLMNDTVDVVLDRWSLKEGQDVFNFMEKMVKSKDIFRVLILCDKKYKAKADDRKGGVGTETQIITPELYSKENQEKFIPIVLEIDDDGKPCLPIYLASRKYIDFSCEEKFEESYEELLRNILEVPSIPKPKLGNKLPTYITEEKVDLSETNSKIRFIQHQLNNHQTVNYKYAKEFIDLFLEKLWNFRINGVSNDIVDFGIKLTDTLKSFKPIREDFIRFIDLMTSFDVNFSSEIMIDFFEHAPLYLRPKKDEGSYYVPEFDALKIIYQELFIYTIAISLKNRNYDFTSELLNSKYFISDSYTMKNEPKSFSFLYKYHDNLETYMYQIYNKITGFGHFVISNLSDQIDKQEFIVADTLCYAVTYLNSTNAYDRWFPCTYLYGERGRFSFFEKISSKKHFDKVKVIFDVKSESELKEKLLKSKEESTESIYYRGGSFERVPFVYQLIDPERISIYR